jgi:hypothetical protein
MASAGHYRFGFGEFDDGFDPFGARRQAQMGLFGQNGAGEIGFSHGGAVSAKPTGGETTPGM